MSYTKGDEIETTNDFYENSQVAQWGSIISQKHFWDEEAEMHWKKVKKERQIKEMVSLINLAFKAILK